MEIYKYALLFFAGYIAVCATFSKIGLPLPICFDSIFGSRIAFVMRYVVFFGFVWWAGGEIYKRYINKKEGYATKASMMANAQTENENGDQSDKNTIYDEFLKNAVDIPENPYEDLLKNARDIPKDGIPKGFYSIKIDSMKNGSLISETKMLPVKYMPKACKYNESTKTIEAKELSNTMQCRGQYYTFFNNTFDNVTDENYGITITSKNAAGNIITEKKMMPVKYMPEGCKLSGMTDKGIVPISPTGNFQKDQEKCRDKFVTYGSGKQITYDADNLDNYNALKEKTSSEKEDLQRKFDVNLDRVKPPPIYYEPGSYTFGATGYIPDYERSIYLSKTTNLSQVDDITVGAPYLEGGFCTQYANSPQNMEQKCQSLDNQTCATTSCCVLLGGQKCVSGDSHGPKIRNNYSDTQIVNRDYYYYQGKCFGNCDPNRSTQVKPSSNPTSMPQWGNQTGAAYGIFKSESITATPAGKPKTPGGKPATPAGKPKTLAGKPKLPNGKTKSEPNENSSESEPNENSSESEPNENSSESEPNEKSSESEPSSDSTN